MIWIFLGTLLAGMIAARTNTVMARGGIEDHGRSSIMIGFFGMLATFALIIAGFFLFAWWVPIVAFIVISVVAGFIAVGDRLIPLFRTSILQNLIAIGGAVYLGKEAWL